MKNIFKKIFTFLVAPVMLVVLTSTAPVKKEQEVIRLGFIPLTDCAPIVMAKELGLFKKYGLNVEVTKEASWANVRDKILTGELDGAHCLFSMPFSVYTGVGGKAGSEMRIAMVLNNNGQAITLSKEFCGKVGQRSDFCNDISRRYPRHMAEVLACSGRCKSEDIEDHHNPSATNGGQHESWKYGWVLCRRTVEWRSRETKHRVYTNRHAGYMGAPS
jgi:hypothetical protein